MNNFDLKKYLAEGRLLREEMELEFFNNDEDVALIANSGEYEAEIEDGKVSFSVVYEDEDDRDGMEFSENNWKSILGPNHAFVEIASKIPTKVEALDDYVMITVDLEDLKGITNLSEGKLLKESAPGYDTRKSGEALPTLENVKAAYEAKMNIKEDEDYDTGGYVEAMNPELFDHIDEVIRIFKEWKDGPMTEPGMEGYAKDDLVDYIQMKIRNA